MLQAKFKFVSQMNKWLWSIWNWMYLPKWNIYPIAYLFKWSIRRSWPKPNFWHSKGNIGLRVSYKLQDLFGTQLTKAYFETLCMEKRTQGPPSLPFCPSVSYVSIMGRKGLLLLLFILVMNCPTKSDTDLDTLLDFCVVKGLKYITIINFSKNSCDLKVIYEKLRVRELKTFPDIFG